MTMCHRCHALEEAPDARAHEGLRLTDAKKRQGGLSSGVVFLYRCGSCGTLWSRTADSMTRSASWVAPLAPGQLDHVAGGRGGGAATCPSLFQTGLRNQQSA
ncbi:hypothetical protein V4F39_04245 [Aquincola sp. MAHUQ-54]|uniref:Uncharacterized protein n=1 Tax=Aquincola agrisoli TaxID=3119538 RepID=A0AAW9Q2C5_9BURK